jgi:NAD dependent epimerase/dehydratase family enzyme
MKKNVLLTGGTGFIGRYLTTMLLEKGYSVSILTRTSKKNTDTISYYIWDVSQNSIEEAAVLNADYIIHLAGENIADKKWTEERKAEIIASREQSIQLIVSVLKKHDKKVEAFVSASGVGIYGALNGKQICAEDTPAANDFWVLPVKNGN